MSVMNLLTFLNAQYVDIWYNRKSETAASYVYENYVLKVNLIQTKHLGRGSMTIDTSAGIRIQLTLPYTK